MYSVLLSSSCAGTLEAFQERGARGAGDDEVMRARQNVRACRIGMARIRCAPPSRAVSEELGCLGISFSEPWARRILVGNGLLPTSVRRFVCVASHRACHTTVRSVQGARSSGFKLRRARRSGLPVRDRPGPWFMMEWNGREYRRWMEVQS